MEVVKEFVSLSETYKSVIFKRNDGLFQIDNLFWYDEYRTWISGSFGLSLAEDETHAEIIALENLNYYLCKSC